MLHEWLLFIHILSAVVYVGGGVTVTMQATAATGAPSQFLRFADLAGRMIGIGAVFTLLTGVALVLESDVWSFTTTFVIIGIGVVTASGAVEGMYSRKKVAAIEAAIEQGGPEAPEVSAGLRQVILVNATVIAFLVLVIWAMVFKPGL
ncbi:MAG: hypothetical protein BMS9Abin07_0088 [Acidimicrobiia bacterium]|nr:MAG: hypothetical protein BMS9Abin07_0088 [Acidimicrobiia bacterium]